MSYPAVSAEGDRIDIVTKHFEGDVQIHVDSYNRKWAMQFDGLRLVADTEPTAQAAPAEVDPEETPETTDDGAAAFLDGAAQIETTELDEDDLEPVASLDPEPADVQAMLEAEEAAALALIDAGGDPFADEAVIPAQPDDPAADA